MSLKEKKPQKLTLKQRKFTAEYLKTGNGTQAAIKAGYSKKSAHDIASENLRKPEIKAVVESAAEKLGINHEYVLGKLKDISDFNSKQIIKTLVKGTIEIHEEQMIDAQAAIRSTELLGKHLNLFSDKLEVTGKDGKDLVPESSVNLENVAKKIALLLSNPNLKK